MGLDHAPEPGAWDWTSALRQGIGPASSSASEMLNRVWIALAATVACAAGAGAEPSAADTTKVQGGARRLGAGARAEQPAERGGGGRRSARGRGTDGGRRALAGQAAAVRAPGHALRLHGTADRLLQPGHRVELRRAPADRRLPPASVPLQAQPPLGEVDPGKARQLPALPVAPHGGDRLRSHPDGEQQARHPGPLLRPVERQREQPRASPSRTTPTSSTRTTTTTSWRRPGRSSTSSVTSTVR